jgi:P-type Cu2+ transporter
MISRLLVCLAFALPLFIWAHMGLPFPPPAPPSGLTLDQWIFVLASGAVLWPNWPLFVAANALLLKRARIPGRK